MLRWRSCRTSRKKKPKNEKQIHMLVVVIIVVEEKTLGLFHGRCGPFFIFWCSRCSGNKKNVKKLKNKHMLVKKRKKLMAQTTTKHRLGLFMGTGPFDSFPGVDGVGSGWPSSWYLVVVIVESRFKKKIHAGARDATYLEPPPFPSPFPASHS